MLHRHTCFAVLGLLTSVAGCAPDAPAESEVSDDLTAHVTPARELICSAQSRAGSVTLKLRLSADGKTAQGTMFRGLTAAFSNGPLS